jgi:hypothetical protein
MRPITLNFHSIIGTPGDLFYAVRAIGPKGGQKHIRMHHVICPPQPGLKTAHRDKDGLNNTRNNLFLASWPLISQTRHHIRRKTSIFLGVSWHPEKLKWRSVCKGRFLGYFDTEEKAAEAYNVAAKSVFGDFAALNKINSFSDVMAM